MNDTTLIEGPGHVGSELHYRSRLPRLAGSPRFDRVLGEGGHGVAILARAQDGSAPYVVKLLRPCGVASPGTVERFRRELLTHEFLSQTLQAPRLVRCLATDAHEPPGLLHGKFGYCESGSLADSIEDGLPVRESLRLLVDAVEGLQALHGHGYVHRDFCPHNILVGREAGIPRGSLGDLGSGVFTRPNSLMSADQIAAELRLRIGHSGYVDPEFANTELGDLFSIGATVFSIMSGETSIPGPGADGIELSSKRCRAGVDDQLREAAAELVRRLTCGDPGRRLASCSAAREALLALPLRRPIEELAAPSPSPRTYPRLAAHSGIAATLALIGGLVLGTGATLLALSPPASEQSTPTATPLRPGPDPAPRQAPAASSSQAVAMHGDVPGKGSRRSVDDLAVDLRTASDPSRVGAELRAALQQAPSRGDVRLAVARTLAADGDLGAAKGVLAATPNDSSYRREIHAMRSALASLGGAGS